MKKVRRLSMTENTSFKIHIPSTVMNIIAGERDGLKQVMKMSDDGCPLSA